MQLLYLPRFHCELNPIELMWCTVKRQLRSKLDGKVQTLRAELALGLAGVKPLWVARWFAHAHSYVRGYAHLTGFAKVFQFVKNSSHRRAGVKNALIDPELLDQADAADAAVAADVPYALAADVPYAAAADVPYAAAADEVEAVQVSACLDFDWEYDSDDEDGDEDDDDEGTDNEETSAGEQPEQAIDDEADSDDDEFDFIQREWGRGFETPLWMPIR